MSFHSMEIPTSPKESRRTVPPGFLPFKSHDRPVQELSTRELNDRYLRNKGILDGPGPSTTSHQRLLNEQAAIENILGIEHLQNTLHGTHITEDDPMGEPVAAAPVSRIVDTKRRVLGRYYNSPQQRGTTVALGLDEAIILEQQAHVAEMERKKHEEERRQRRLPRPGENLTQEEIAARIWAYMNTKPSESDEEDEDWNESDEDEDDPATWFEEEDETQGQPLIDPDELADIIRVDDSHWHD